MAIYELNEDTLPNIAEQTRNLNGTSGGLYPSEIIDELENANNEIDTQSDLLDQIRLALNNKSATAEQIEELIKDVRQITPTTTPSVGQMLKVQSVNADGSFVCEWVDANTDMVGIQAVSRGEFESMTKDPNKFYLVYSEVVE